MTSLLQPPPPPKKKQSLEDRLRALDAFLGDYLQRRRTRRPGLAEAEGAMSGGAGGSVLPLAKRQRLEDAAQLELKRYYSFSFFCF